MKQLSLKILNNMCQNHFYTERDWLTYQPSDAQNLEKALEVIKYRQKNKQFKAKNKLYFPINFCTEYE
ncbi:MAG: hypothetical protein SAK42_23340, partial [Oscillatoria sp. PMC 1076.18]|nr:hypothetical protein [Oscillatoria sp. PMC 1076.18]